MTIIFLSNPCTFPLATLSSLPPFFSGTARSLIPTLRGVHHSLPFSTAISLNPSPQPKYTYPDPIPEFAEYETQKFKGELLRKLSTNKEIGGDLNEVVNVCAELNKEGNTKWGDVCNTKGFGEGIQISVSEGISNPCIFSDFLHTEYGGPGTLVVEPFTDMMIALKEKKLPGAPEAARAALLWAQNYLDRDWQAWISQTKVRNVM